MFSLTKRERQLVAYIIAALLLGSAVRYYRQTYARPVALVEQKTK